MTRFRVFCAVFMVLASTFSSLSVLGQTAPEPIREKLLNGLTIFYWPRPGDQNVLMKLRINSGAAFDLAGKDGLMALLADALFPDPTARDYVREQLGGRLDVVTTHDTIEVTISGTVGQFERIVELVRNAVVAMQLTPENVARLRDERVKRLSEKNLVIAEIADRAVAQRLFGRFPYARLTEGSADSIARIDRADLMLARERFLNADNATIAIVGGVEKGRAMRALRQLLGPWNKGDRTVPSSFRQSDPPDSRVLVLNEPNATTAEIRIATRGLARSDRDDLFATSLLTRIVRDRWRANSPDLSSVSVRHDAHTLPGIFVMSATAPLTSAAYAIVSARKILSSLAEIPPSPDELERARSQALTENSQRLSQTESVAGAWLDMVTFRAPSPGSLDDSIRKATLLDIQRTAARLFKNARLAVVAVGDSQQLKASFTDPIELREAADRNDSSNTATPARKP